MIFSVTRAVAPKIIAGNVIVSDLTLQTQSEKGTIFLIVKDTNETDKKIIVPLPEGTTYTDTSTPNIGVTQDTVNKQIVIDWER